MPNQNKKTFVIIDGNAIIHRAYHALPPLTAKDGTMVNAVYGFTSMLLKVLNDLKPDYMAVSFDVAGETFRGKMFEGYKAKRVKAGQELYDQIPLVYQVVEAFEIPIYIKEGYEADDVIGTVANYIKKEKLGIKSIIVTGDMDLLQLVDDNITEVYLLRKGLSDFQLYNEKAVIERFGFGPKHIVDYKSLRGDSSDNIPGVKGIGEKTAVELITKVGGIADIYKKIESLKDYKISDGVIKKLIDDKDNALMSQELATICEDVKGLEFDLKKCENGPFDREKVVKLMQKFEFYSLAKRISGNAEAGRDLSVRTEQKKKSRNSQKLIIADKKNINDILQELKKEEVVACKEILSGAEVLTSDLLGLVFATKNGSYYIEKPTNDIFKLFEDEKKITIGHDVKSLIKVLKCSSAQVSIVRHHDRLVSSQFKYTRT